MTLNDLMEKYGSDKAVHGYCEFYESYFGPIRESAKSVLEIGVYYGASIRAWLDYFPNAKVWGLDDGHFQRSWGFGTDRVQVFLTDQSSRSALAALLTHTGGEFDVVLDDGAHSMWGQQTSLACLLPGVRSGGFYVVEDLFSSFQEFTTYKKGGLVTRSNATGCDFPLTTTYEVLSRFPHVKSDYMTEEEWDVLVARVANVDIFDRDGDHRHCTVLLEVK
jgi:hypothetical protein